MEDKKILVETSARHVHLTQETLDVLFGKGYKLTVKKMLSQPGMFASTDKIKVLGFAKDPSLPRPELVCSILGPLRDHNQVELSATECRQIGIPAPVRESGDIKGSGKCTLIGPKGQVDLAEGVIIAKRHIHMTPKDAEDFGVKNGDIVCVKVATEQGRNLIFGDTVIRVSPNFALAMHIDTDECNAACAGGVVYGTIVMKKGDDKCCCQKK
jgi:putative phosphotransacetylase